jgi:hypothetical protein
MGAPITDGVTMVRAPALLAAACLALAACAPKVGSPEWCQKMKEKPKADWTANEAGDFLKHCVVPGTTTDK